MKKSSKGKKTKETKEKLNIQKFESIPKGPREIIFLDLPTEKILELCEESAILKQTCLDEKFWREKLRVDEWKLDNQFDKFVAYWKPTEMTEAEFLMSICGDGKVLSDYFYSIDAFLEIQRLADDFIKWKNQPNMPPSFPQKKYKSVLQSLIRIPFEKDEMIKWDNYREDLNFIHRLIERRMNRKNYDEYSSLTIRMPLFSSFPNLDENEYLSQLNDPEFEFDPDDFSYNPDNDEQYGDDNFTGYIDREKYENEINEIVIRWMKILKKYLKEGDILSYLNDDRKETTYFYVYFVEGKPYLQELIQKKYNLYLPPRALFLLEKLKPKTIQELMAMFASDKLNELIFGFITEKNGEIIYYEMGDARHGKSTKMTDDWSIYQVEKKLGKQTKSEK